MGLFRKPQGKSPSTNRYTNSSGKSLDRLINNELPFGWITHNQTFTDKISKEYSYFLHQWINARDKSPKELYSALKSFVSYMEDTEKLCKSKGECFEFWFYEILTGKNYLNIRKKELINLTQNLSRLQTEYEHHQKMYSELETALFNFLIQNDGILQKDIYKYFDPSVKQDIQSFLYQWAKSKKIKREKSGNTYKITML